MVLCKLREFCQLRLCDKAIDKVLWSYTYFEEIGYANYNFEKITDGGDYGITSRETNLCRKKARL